MGTVYRKQTTRPLPAGATLGVEGGREVARWLVRGRKRSAPTTTGRDGEKKIVQLSGTYVMKYRDAEGEVVEETTGCRDESAARRILTDREQQVEKIKAGIYTQEELSGANHKRTPLKSHVEAYLDHLRAGDAGRMHVDNTTRFLNRLVADCGFARLSDITREALERWLRHRRDEGMGARNRNIHRSALVAFCNWCCDSERMASNPVERVPKADERADPRRRRRALTEDELGRLLQVAAGRPLAEALTVRTGKDKGERKANVRSEVQVRLRELGRERALIYKTLVLTGLRRGELASITVGQVDLDADPPGIELEAVDEKSGEGNTLPLRADLAEDLAAWLADRLSRLRQRARDGGLPLPAKLPPEIPLFTVPRGLVRILDRDLVAAGIARLVTVDGRVKIDKRDDRGRTVDVHALRTTFGTLLSKGGVAPRTAQAAMRHSDIKLTMGVYTDPKLLDVRGALDALPALPLDGKARPKRKAAR